eukprot:TCONS_00051257-protein
MKYFKKLKKNSRKMYRQNFLPTLIESCQETDVLWSKDEKDSIHIGNDSTNGFDRSGKYYTIHLRGSPNKILVYHFDSDFRANMINLEITDSDSYVKIIYDPFTARTFYLSTDFVAEGITLNIESGCLKEYFGTSLTLPLKAKYKSDCIQKLYEDARCMYYQIRVVGDERFLEILLEQGLEQKKRNASLSYTNLTKKNWSISKI